MDRIFAYNLVGDPKDAYDSGAPAASLPRTWTSMPELASRCSPTAAAADRRSDKGIGVGSYSRLKAAAFNASQFPGFAMIFSSFDRSSNEP